jgi:hypothetical protein
VFVQSRVFHGDSAVLFVPNEDLLLADLQQQLRRSERVTCELIADVTARVCTRLQAQQLHARQRLLRLTEAGAFTDAALALLELELPKWKLRRLIYDGGGWHCALSQQPEIPAELDETAEALHETLPLAILSACVEARRHDLSAPQSAPKSCESQVGRTNEYALCCDNFA